MQTPQKWFDQREEADSLQKFEEKDKGDRTVGVTQGGATQVWAGKLVAVYNQSIFRMDHPLYCFLSG